MNFHSPSTIFFSFCKTQTDVEVWTSGIRAVDLPLIPPPNIHRQPEKQYKRSLLINGCLKPTSRCSWCKSKDVEKHMLWVYFFFPLAEQVQHQHKHVYVPFPACFWVIKPSGRRWILDQKNPMSSLRGRRNGFFLPYRSQPWCWKTYKEKKIVLERRGLSDGGLRFQHNNLAGHSALIYTKSLD